MLAGGVNEVLLVGEEKEGQDEDDVPLTQLLIQKVSRGCAMRGNSPHVAHAKKIFDRDEVEFMIYDICRSTKKNFLFTVTFDVSPRINAAGRGDVLQGMEAP